jgi:SAM-dependent methyltransferase
MNKPIRHQPFACRICSKRAESEIFLLSEMMHGTRETFEYAKCSNCGCLQILEIPADLGRYYPQDYYSMQPRDEPDEYKGIKRLIAQWYCRSAALTPSSILGHTVRRLLPMPTDFVSYGTYLIESRLRSSRDKILDVGCGASPNRLAAFRRCGFRNVEGVDPFIEKDHIYEGVPVLRRTIDQLEGEYGLVMLHHSLEHTPDPVGTLRHAARLLRPDGTCLIRVPVMGTYFWRRFGENWVELDPPRHLYSFSVDAMRLLGEQTGLRLYKTTFDSSAWEIAASIRYERGIPLRSTQKSTDGFSATELSEFNKKAQELNDNQDAGRACFYFKRI